MRPQRLQHLSQLDRHNTNTAGGWTNDTNSVSYTLECNEEPPIRNFKIGPVTLKLELAAQNLECQSKRNISTESEASTTTQFGLTNPNGRDRQTDR